MNIAGFCMLCGNYIRGAEVESCLKTYIPVYQTAIPVPYHQKIGRNDRPLVL